MSLAREMARKAHRGLNVLLIGGMVVQFWAAGWAAFGQPFTIHALLGWSLLAASILLALLSATGYGKGGVTLASASLVVVLGLQPVFVFVLSEVSLVITAMHPVNGLLALYLVLWMEWRKHR